MLRPELQFHQGSLCTQCVAYASKKEMTRWPIVCLKEAANKKKIGKTIHEMKDKSKNRIEQNSLGIGLAFLTGVNNNIVKQRICKRLCQN